MRFPSNVDINVNPFPSYPENAELSKPGDETVSIDDYGTLDHVLAAGYREGLFGTSPKEKRLGPVDRARRRTIAMQLHLLGYLPEQPGHDIAFDRIRPALNEFRTEAGIPAPAVDAGTDRIDDDTWYAIHSLVAFEPMEGAELDADTIDARWIRGGEPTPPLRRAILLRLHVLGFGKRPPRTLSEPWNMDVLLPFIRVTRLFQIFGTSLPGLPVILARLFDADGILQAVAAAETSDDAFDFRTIRSRNLRVSPDAVRSFIINVAKIELWLLGFSVRLDGESDYPVAATDPQNFRWFRRLTRQEFQASLESYWRDLAGVSSETAQRRAKQITPSLFTSLLHHGTDSPSRFEKEDYSKELALEHLSSNEEIEKVWSEVGNRRLSLWDGLKRVWRWVKTKAQAIFRAARAALKNIARAAFRYATKAFKTVRLAITSTVEGIRYFLGGELASDPPGTAFMSFRKDMDATLRIRPDASEAPLEQFWQLLDARTTAFVFATEIIATVLSILLSIARGITGWARLIRALVHSLRDLKPAYRKLVEAREAAGLPV